MVERIWSENSFCLRAYRSIPRITSLRSSLRVLNRPANISFAFFCRSDSVTVMTSAITFCASSRGVRRAASRATKFLIVASLLPNVSDVVDGRSGPHGGNGDFRHFDLAARPIGKARIGGERRAPQGQFNGDGRGDTPTSHAPPPGSPRRARNPREGSYARIAPTMNSAVHPPTTASEIQLIWQ